jgi:hypothetical protein
MSPHCLFRVATGVKDVRPRRISVMRSFFVMSTLVAFSRFSMVVAAWV